MFVWESLMRTFRRNLSRTRVSYSSKKKKCPTKISLDVLTSSTAGTSLFHSWNSEVPPLELKDMILKSNS